MAKFHVALRDHSGIPRTVSEFEAEYMKAVSDDGERLNFVEFKDAQHRLVRAYNTDDLVAVEVQR